MRQIAVLLTLLHINLAIADDCPSCRMSQNVQAGLTAGHETATNRNGNHRGKDSSGRAVDEQQEQMRVDLERLVGSRGEPGEGLIIFRQNLSDAVKEAENGDLSKLNDLLDKTRGSLSDEKDCNVFDTAVDKLYLQGDHAARARSTHSLRQIPTKDLIHNYNANDKDKQSEFWRRVDSIRTWGHNMWSRRQLSNFMTQYFLSDKDPKKRATVLIELVSKGPDEEMLKLLSDRTALVSAFPCTEPLMEYLAIFASAFSKPSRERDRTLWASSLPNDLKEAALAVLNQRSYVYDFSNHHQRIHGMGTADEFSNYEKARQIWLRSFQEPYQPTLGEYLTILKTQRTDQSLPKSARDRVEARFLRNIEALVYADKKGTRKIIIDGQPVALSPFSSDPKGPPPDLKHDLKVLENLAFEKANISIPQFVETAGPPPTSADYRMWKKGEEQYLSSPFQSESEKRAAKLEADRYFRELAEGHRYRYGEEPPQEIFSKLTDPESKIRELEIRLQQLEAPQGPRPAPPPPRHSSW